MEARPDQGRQLRYTTAGLLLDQFGKTVGLIRLQINEEKSRGIDRARLADLSQQSLFNERDCHDHHDADTDRDQDSCGVAAGTDHVDYRIAQGQRYRSWDESQPPD